MNEPGLDERTATAAVKVSSANVNHATADDTQMLRISYDDSKQSAAVKVPTAAVNHPSADDTRENQNCRAHFSNLKSWKRCSSSTISSYSLLLCLI